MPTSYLNLGKGKMKKSEWNQRIQTLGLQYRESALLNCNDGEQEGILDLSDRLQNICFVQGLASDHIQTIVWRRNYLNSDEIADCFSGRWRKYIETKTV
jgi:hypothetical protein